MTFKQIKFILWQLFGMFVFLVCGFLAGYVYFVGAQKNAAKQADTETIETPAEPELTELEPISFSQPTATTNAARIAKVKSAAKSSPAKVAKPVTHSAPAKVAPVVAKKAVPVVAKKRNAAVAAKEAVPAAQRPVSLSSAQIRNLTIKSAERLDYSAPEFRAELKEQAKSILQWNATDKSKPSDIATRQNKKK